MVRGWKIKWVHFSRLKSRGYTRGFLNWTLMVQGNWNQRNYLTFLN